MSRREGRKRPSESDKEGRLVRFKYSHLAHGCTGPQALRLAMLHLARRPPLHEQTRDRAAGARVCKTDRCK